ncbi:Uncharacterised protein (plasmid) [Tsukamurella tyrosinosolvens]|uniref:Uncharacterized protein n=1 Tax=Tsukamurella tyrosinosolvens TaxID=57704 RepID=A0A1H4V7X1_TSUTY|nr:GAF domain-containing protein [Tsukamurella tyrosinosolvens]KXO91030.1 hypothetical protein AXK58_21610 [Tsukamurella tyrosinosolvens]SEC76970.1 hypothetical protein SAMN04489793_3167 [Tsukamurella tyrosinosolvens]VEH90638.1 Uncharacterised protein [Tsukamurella tyrosinosolvens]
MAKTHEWLLIETLDERTEPTVIAQGSRVRKMVPLHVIFDRNPKRLVQVSEAVRQVAATGTTVVEPAGDLVFVAEPAALHNGRVHGVWVRFGPPGEAAPPRNRTWGFVWNLTRGIANKSKGLLPDDSEETTWSIAEAYAVLANRPDAVETMAKVINADPGTTHQATWNQRREEGPEHAVNFAVRILEERNADGKMDRILRGISNDLGPAKPDEPSTRRPILLAELIAAAEAAEGEYRAVVDPRTLRLIDWYGDPMPELAWRYEPGDPELVHPDDRARALEMMTLLGKQSRIEMDVRLRLESGDYGVFHAVGKLMVLDNRTNAALVALTRPSDS